LCLHLLDHPAHLLVDVAEDEAEQYKPKGCHDIREQGVGQNFSQHAIPVL
jgi:hypothetical protein